MKTLVAMVIMLEMQVCCQGQHFENEARNDGIPETYTTLGQVAELLGQAGAGESEEGDKGGLHLGSSRRTRKMILW